MCRRKIKIEKTKIERLEIMMINSLFSIYDKKSKQFNKIIEQTNNMEAIRTFGDIVRDQKTMIAKHPEDFCLMRLGTMNTESGKIGLEEDPLLIAEAMDFKEKEE
jgi:hypothetical protein